MFAQGFSCDITLLLGFVPPCLDISLSNSSNIFSKYVIYGNKSSGQVEDFNKLFFQKMSICTWNANGLFCHNLSSFNSKIRIMRSICERLDIVFCKKPMITWFLTLSKSIAIISELIFSFAIRALLPKEVL